MTDKQSSAQDWQQIIIIHVSDLHFGQKHRFDPSRGDDGKPGPRLGIPKLHESLVSDLTTANLSNRHAFGLGFEFPIRVIFALTGDFAEVGAEEEYDEARDFLAAFCGKEVFGWRLRRQDFFLVPGNHDVRYVPNHSAERWIGYCRFYNDHLAALHGEEKGIGQPPRFDERTPHLLSRIIDQSNHGLIVAEINSSAYVEKGKPGERRGEIDQGSVGNLGVGLRAIDRQARNNSIRIALIHHHPILLPGLAEPDKGNDAIGYGEMLLNLLRDEAFHLVLHGHKHVPYTFLYDAELAWATDRVRPIMVAAGGSAGSTDLVNTDGAKNTYNLISIKWQSAAGQVRIHTETRGLVLKDANNRDMPATDWHWRTLAIDDRVLAAPRSNRIAVDKAKGRTRTPEDEPFEKARFDVIKDCRRNYPAIKVLPSFEPDQGYEAWVWIEAQDDKPGRDYPVRVEYSAGPYFQEIAVVEAATDPQFRTVFSYYGPTLIQARMYWSDGTHSVSYIFAHYPRQELEIG